MLLKLFNKSGGLYRQYGVSFTRVLMNPFLKMTLWSYAALILMRFSLSPWATSTTGVNIWFLVLMIGAIIAFYLSLTGLWDYLIYSASLNLNADAIIAQREDPAKPRYSTNMIVYSSMNFKTAFHTLQDERRSLYMGLISWITLIPIMAFLPGLITVLMHFIGHSDDSGGIVLGLLLLIMGGIFSLLFLLLCTFIFQIVVFEPELKKPLAIIRRSIELVRQSFCITLGLQLLLWIATNVIVPMPFDWLAHLVRVDIPLNMLHAWLIQPFLYAPLTPYLGQFVTFITDTTIMMSITMLLLPWGTFAFTLLYRSLPAKVKIVIKGE